MVTLIKLILLVCVIYFIITVYKTVRKLLGSGIVLGGNATPFAKGEECPSCHVRIRLPQEPGSCPKCHATLGRSPEGKLLIRVN